MEATNSATEVIIKKFGDFWDLLNNLSLIQWLIVGSIVVGPSIIYFCRFLRFQWIFAGNLKRKIYFLKTHISRDLQNERDQLVKVGLFNIERDIKNIEKDLRALQNIQEFCVLVVGYHREYKYFKELFAYAIPKSVPIIIYAKQGEIRDSSHWETFNNYIYCDVVNYPNRLAIILLNTLMIIRKP